MTRKHTTCPACFNRIPVKTYAPDRVTLERDRGETFPVTCPECGTTSIVHVNKVVAKPNHTITFIISLAMGLFWVVFFLFGGFKNMWTLILAGSMIGIPTLVRQAVNRQAEAFNEYKL